MARGLKAVKAGSNIKTQDQTQIAVDTTQQGGMKIVTTLYVKDSMATQYLNGFGISVGKYQYAHGLGYPPAFLGFQYQEPYVYNDGTTNYNYDGTTYLLPSIGPLGGPDFTAFCDDKYIYIDGMPAPNSSSAPQWAVIVIFEEKLSA